MSYIYLSITWSSRVYKLQVPVIRLEMQHIPFAFLAYSNKFFIKKIILYKIWCVHRERNKKYASISNIQHFYQKYKKNLEPKHRFHTYFSSKFPLLNNKDS